jgi:tRNA pseudouridine38-40 synthase
MRNYKVTLEYDGTNYSGLQFQKNDRNTIHEAVFLALSKLLCGKVRDLSFCGRTDGGVHAFGQVFNVKTDFDFTFPEGKLALGLNYHLRGQAISAVDSVEVPLEFHARFSCKSRTYKYKILNRSVKSPIYANRAWFLPYKFRLEDLREILQTFVGKHDFADFRASECSSPVTIRDVNLVNVAVSSDDIIEITISAPSFLYQMVRGIIGASIDCVRGKFALEQISKSLKNPEGKHFFQFAPPCGLYFLKADF